MRLDNTLLTALTLTLGACSLVGCGGSAAHGSTTPATETQASTEPTAGGEAESPRALYTTTPVPVPSPGVPRERLAEPAQQIWLEVERAVAERPPEPPSDVAATDDALRRWYTDAFTPWLARRLEAATRADGRAAELAEARPWEWGVAAGLLGYLYEQTAAEARGAPIPASIVNDAELLAVYSGALDEALLPMARRALEAYRFCLAAFGDLAGSPEAEVWQEWGAWCEDRSEELVRVYAPAASVVER